MVVVGFGIAATVAFTACEKAGSSICQTCKGLGYVDGPTGQTDTGRPIYTKKTCSSCHGTGKR